MVRVAVAAPSMLRSCAATHLSSAPTKPTANPQAAKFGIFLELTLMRTKGAPVNARCAKASPPAARNFRNSENSVNLNEGIPINIPDFPDMKYPEIVACVKAFMIFNERPAEEALQEKHFWHFQPSNGQAGTRFHIVIDIDKFGHSGAIERDFPHEIYRVVKNHDEIRIVPYPRKNVRDHLLCKIRDFSDANYPWGKDR
ncbi:hypothetical protein DTO013F2_8648 [Penicillium roqueforti]|nr:hypothetical protein DTO013F2_8648 [Penicillium roqueforti]